MSALLSSSTGGDSRTYAKHKEHGWRREACWLLLRRGVVAMKKEMICSTADIVLRVLQRRDLASNWMLHGKRGSSE